MLGLARLPGDAAELVERHFRALAAKAREQIDVFDRQEELRALGILQLKAGMRRTGGLDGAKPTKRPMPCSAWTTMAPSSRPATSEM